MLNDKYIKILKSLEGFSEVPYKCSAGVMTIGYGHSEYMDNLPLNTKSITEEEATVLLKKDVSKFEDIVTGAVRVPLTDNQLASLTFFVFNIGGSAFKRSTLLKKLNKGDYNAVPSELLRWTKVNGKQSVGLSIRRHKEIELWHSEQIKEPIVNILPKPHTNMSLPHKEFTVNASTAILGLLADNTGNGILQWTFAILIIIIFIYCAIMYKDKLRNLW